MELDLVSYLRTGKPPVVPKNHLADALLDKRCDNLALMEEVAVEIALTFGVRVDVLEAIAATPRLLAIAFQATPLRIPISRPFRDPLWLLHPWGRYCLTLRDWGDDESAFTRLEIGVEAMLRNAWVDAVSALRDVVGFASLKYPEDRRLLARVVAGNIHWCVTADQGGQ